MFNVILIWCFGLQGLLWDGKVCGCFLDLPGWTWFNELLCVPD